MMSTNDQYSGGMDDYGDQIPDRRCLWAIVAYLRALQLSRPRLWLTCDPQPERN